MSASEAPLPTNGATDAEASEPRERESLAGVVGVGAALAVLVLCALTLVAYGPRSVAAEQALARGLRLEALPEGLALEPTALLLPSGEQVVTLSDGSPLDLDPKELVMRSSMGGGGGGGGFRGPAPGMNGGMGGADFEPYDWAGVETVAEDTLPARLYLVRFPEQHAGAVLARQFRWIHWRDLRELGAQGGTAVVGGGKIPWAGYGADFVRERRFIEGGTFRDTMRVNLSLGRDCWIAYAIWPEGHLGSEEVLGEVLAAFRPQAAVREQAVRE